MTLRRFHSDLFYVLPWRDVTPTSGWYYTGEAVRKFARKADAVRWSEDFAKRKRDDLVVRGADYVREGPVPVTGNPRRRPPSELSHATAIVRGLRTASVIQYPSKAWGFVGRVPMELSFVMKDGSPVSDEMAANINNFGAGLYKSRITHVTFPTQEAAERALADFSGRAPRAGNPTDLTVANTIIQQLGGGRFQAMTGAHTFLGDANSVSFRLPLAKHPGAVNYVKITLTGRDDYDVEFYRIRGRKSTLVSSTEGIYADQLREVFERATGLYTSLGTMGRNPRSAPRNASNIVTDADVRGVIYRLSQTRAGGVTLGKLLDTITTTGDMDADLEHAVRLHLERAQPMPGLRAVSRRRR
jgi:hypothetical protein